jgi:uncharacterized protein YndB with AHSA1/START domain
LDAGDTITVAALVRAPAAKAWQSYTAPDEITQWNHASDDWHTPWAENDLRPGGKFLYRMEAKDGSFGFDFCGTYERVESNQCLAYTLDDGRRVTVTLEKEEAGGTCIAVEFEPEAANSIELQRSGWQAILDSFKAYVEAQNNAKDHAPSVV